MVPFYLAASAKTPETRGTNGAPLLQQQQQQQLQQQQQQQLQQHKMRQVQHWQRRTQQRQAASYRGDLTYRHQHQHQQQQQQSVYARRVRGFLGMLVAAAFVAICCCRFPAAVAAAAAAGESPRRASRSVSFSYEVRSLPSTPRLRVALPHVRQLLLQSHTAKTVETGSPFALLQESKPGAQNTQKPHYAFSPLLKHLPRRLKASVPHQQQQEHQQQGLSLALAMPLCRLSFEDLAPKLGGGTYGDVYPLKASEGPCKEIAATAGGTKFAVKIFRLRGLAALMAAAEEGRKDLKETELETVKKTASELGSVNLKDPAMVTALKDVLESDKDMDTLQSLQKEKELSAQTFLNNFASIRSAIHTKCFLDELQETGLIFRQINEALKDIDPENWNPIKDASEAQRVSAFAALGGQKFHWSLPMARILAKDKHGRMHWGLLVKLFDGDMEPQANRNADGSALDGWEKGKKNTVLREFFGDTQSLMDISAKVVQPFVFMHNFFSFGHFDIKPANILFTRKEKIAEVKIGQLAAGDFGMATPLGQHTLMRGTMAFMAPEIERPKKQSTPPPKLVAEAAHDVFALGLTLAHFWSVSTFCPVSYPWVERCISPHLEGGATFSFESMASTTAAQLYTPEVRGQLKKCFLPGGKMEKLYFPKMPLLYKIKIAQMAEIDPGLRISMSNAFAYFKVAQALHTVLVSPAGDKKLLDAAEDTVLLRLSLQNAELKSLGTEGSQRQTHARLALKALQDLALAGPVRIAASAAASPEPLEKALTLEALPKATEQETEAAKKQLVRELGWPEFQQQEEKKGRAYEDHVDAILGLDMKGVEALLEQETVARKMATLNVALARAVRDFLQQEYAFEPNVPLLEETPRPEAFAVIFKVMGIDPTKSNEMQAYLKDRVLVSFSSWASADRLVRLALRRCVSSSPSMLSVHTKYSSGAAVSSGEAKDFQACIWSHLEAIAQETHYGLPWGVSGAFSDFGGPETVISDFVKENIIKTVAETTWTQENLHKLLKLQVMRAVSRLTSSNPLPGGVNLRGVYTAVLKEMSIDRFVPLPFGVWEERPEYAEILYGFSLQQFREAVTFTATKEELLLNLAKTLQGMEAEERAACTAETLRQQIPDTLRSPQRFGPTAEEGEKVLKETVAEALAKAKQREPDATELLRVTVNGSFFRSPKTDKQKGRPAAKELRIHPKTTAGFLNEHFTGLLAKSLAPGCGRYTATLKFYKETGRYEAVGKTQVLGDEALKASKLRIFAVPPKGGSNARSLNNCFLWTAEILTPGPYVLPSPADSASQPGGEPASQPGGEPASQPGGEPAS